MEKSPQDRVACCSGGFHRCRLNAGHGRDRLRRHCSLPRGMPRSSRCDGACSGDCDAPSLPVPAGVLLPPRPCEQGNLGCSNSGPSPAETSVADHGRDISGRQREIQTWIRQKAARTPPGTWIEVPRNDLTRLVERRFPTPAELDAACSTHPVAYESVRKWALGRAADWTGHLASQRCARGHQFRSHDRLGPIEIASIGGIIEPVEGRASRAVRLTQVRGPPVNAAVEGHFERTGTEPLIALARL